MADQNDNQNEKRCLYCGKTIQEGKFCGSKHKSAYYNQKRKRICITLSFEEYERLLNEASQLNTKVATLVKHRALRKKSDHLKENIHLTKLKAELGKIGSNYNQIAHRLNQLKYTGDISNIDYFDIKKILSQHSKQHFENIWKTIEEFKKNNQSK